MQKLPTFYQKFVYADLNVNCIKHFAAFLMSLPEYPITNKQTNKQNN